MLKVKSYPHPDTLDHDDSGIAQVVLAYARHLPAFGVELVPPASPDYDLLVTHAASAGALPADVHHSHGLLWTGMWRLGANAHHVNRDLVGSITRSRAVTTPSQWVAQTLRRDMHLNPYVIPHGVDAAAWDHNESPANYVLWGKNRTTDGLEPARVVDFARRFPEVTFITTYAPAGAPDNVKVIGRRPHGEFRQIIRRATALLATDRETFGLLPLECLAAGVPVLTPNEGAVPTLVRHRQDGYCYTDPDDAFAGLAYILAHRDRLGEAARLRARDFPWERGVAMLARLYHRLARPDPPSVAIVIPAYNYAHTLEQAVASALAQGEVVREIVVVDDASTDETPTLLSALASRDRRIEIRRHPTNLGVAEARNTGWRVTTASHVVFLDADDFLEPDFARTLLAEAVKEGAGITYTGIRVHLDDGRMLIPHDFPINPGPDEARNEHRWPTTPDYDAFLNQRHNQVPTACLIDRRALEASGGFRSRYSPRGAGSEDAELFFRLVGLGWRLHYVPSRPEALFVHRHGQGYVSGQWGYEEPDWQSWKPWVQDAHYPLAAPFTPVNGLAHPVRFYDRPRVSVIIPVGPGHEAAVVTALDSLEAQTERLWEVVVVNDCHYEVTDRQRVSAIQWDYVRRAFPFITLVHTSPHHRGSGAARNLGARHAQADLIAFLDADDYYHPEFLARTLDHYATTGEVVYTDFVTVMTEVEHEEMKGEIVGRRPPRGGYPELVMVKDTFMEFDCHQARQRPAGRRPYVWSGVTILLPRAWHEAIGGFDESLETWEDCDYLLRLAWAGHCFNKLPEHLWLYDAAAGWRRKQARDLEPDLVALFQAKYDRQEIDMGCNCGGAPGPLVGAKTWNGSFGAQEESIMNDGKVAVLYRHPTGNIGKVDVYGTYTMTHYGRRRNGDPLQIFVEDLLDKPHSWTCITCRTPYSHQRDRVFCACGVFQAAGTQPERRAEPEAEPEPLPAGPVPRPAGPVRQRPDGRPAYVPGGVEAEAEPDYQAELDTAARASLTGHLADGDPIGLLVEAAELGNRAGVVISSLEMAGYPTVGDFRRAPDEELVTVKWVKEKTLARLREADPQAAD